MLALIQNENKKGVSSIKGIVSKLKSMFSSSHKTEKLSDLLERMTEGIPYNKIKEFMKDENLELNTKYKVDEVYSIQLIKKDEFVVYYKSFFLENTVFSFFDGNIIKNYFKFVLFF